MSLKPKVALAKDVLLELSKLPAAIQGKVLRWALRFQNDPTSTAINYESIASAREKNLKSVRIDLGWRGIVFQPPEGDVYVLMHVGKHDEAYRWAEGRRVAVNPVTGSLQIIETENMFEQVVEAPPTLPAWTMPVSGKPQDAGSVIVDPPLFAFLSEADLQSLGTPIELLQQVSLIKSEAGLDALQSKLPVEAYEGLYLVMSGDTVQNILSDREVRTAQVVDVSDFSLALETAESQSRFVVVADEETMAAIMNSPLEFWRVFLHPTQRVMAQGDRSGPVRILGGAGTGKTVLAMHRAKWLADERATVEHKVLFTTFTRNLALDIEENLKTLCSPQLMQRMEVSNLDAWVHGFLRRRRYEHRIIYGRRQDEAADAWQRALAIQDSTLGFSAEFYEEELELVVLAQGVASRDEYRLVKRTGRGMVLTRSKRDAIWPVFEEYRAQLASRSLKEVNDAYRDAVALMKGEPQPYAAVVVDETQDFSPQALRLLRAIVPRRENDLFFVGDGHQRIYPRNRAAMGACGIDIRGRSRKLYLNYRTTEEIRRLAVATLEGRVVDDLDNGLDEIGRYKSLSHGPVPRTLVFHHLEEALEAILPILQDSIAGGRSVCVIVPTKHEVNNVYARLKVGKIASQILSANDRDKSGNDVVRISTMHRAKGLEFDEVVVLMAKEWRGSKASVENSTKLIYVAISRAKQMVSVVQY